METANITKNQNGVADLFTNLHKLLGTEVALEICLATTIEEIINIAPLAALQAECIEHKAELQVIINSLAEFLNNTPISIKVAAAFTDGTDIIYAMGPCLQQPNIAAVLTRCHGEIICIIKKDCLAFTQQNEMRPFLLETLSSHKHMERDLQKFI